MLGAPVAAAFIARRLNRSSLLWSLLCFFSPLAFLLTYSALPHPRSPFLRDILLLLIGPAFAAGMLLLPAAKDKPKESNWGFTASLIAFAVLILAFFFTMMAHFPVQH